MALLQRTLDSCNPYVAAYKHMHTVEQETLQSANERGEQVPTIQMVIKRGTAQINEGQHRGRYNEPRHDEVAAVFVGLDGAPPTL